MSRQRSGSRREDKSRGVFIVRVTYLDEQGKRHDVRRQAKTASEADRLKRTLLRNIEENGARFLDGSRMTFAELADRYAEKKLVKPVYKGETKISGLRSWRAALSLLKPLRGHFGKQRIQSITHADIETYRSERVKTPTIHDKERTITGVNRELQLLRAILNFAKRNGWLMRNPFEQGESLISLADENRRDRILTPDEEARLLAACVDKRAHIRPLIIAAIDTAMRRGELLKMKWSDIDLAGNLITIRKTTTKTWEGRTIGTTSRLRAELERLWEQGTGDVDELIFGIKADFKRAFAAACKQALIEGLHFHDLRHTATTRMVQAGMPPLEVMKITGHRQMATFLRYLNADHQTARRAAEALDALYEPKAKEPEAREFIN